MSAAEAATAQADSVTSVSGLLNAMPDPAAVDEHWRRICREMVTDTAASEYERGLADGYVLAVADLKAFQQGAVRDAQAERRRWHVCCRRCRLAGHREGCADCRDRTRETSAQATSGDRSPAEIRAKAAASWEPLGLGPGPGWVHLGGPTVHHHGRPCTPACHAYEPGWYTLNAAIAIIATLPGDYAAVLNELRVQAASAGKAAA